MPTPTAEQVPLVVGAVTLVLGTGLAVAPHRAGPALRLGDDHRRSRAVGIADLALVPGLLAGRPRWPWMAARGALNVAIAAHYASQGERAGVGAMAALTVADGAVATVLRRSGR